MKRKGLLLVVALLALSGLMAAMAYSQAIVTNAASLTVTSTKNSLLSLQELARTIGTRDQTAYVTDSGDLVFSFGRGYNGGIFGLQRNSVYQWGNEYNTGMFKIRNESSEQIQIYLAVENVPAGVHIYAKSTSGNVDTAASRPWIEVTGSETIIDHCNINRSTSHVVAVRVVVDEDAQLIASSGMKIIVTSKAIESYDKN